MEEILHAPAAMPRASAKPKETWTTNVAANGLHRAGACAEKFYSLKPGDPLEPHRAQIMHLLEGRARQDNKYKAASRQGRPWEGRKLTAAEKAYIWAKSRGKCNHPYCKEPWIKLHYKTRTKSRFTIDHLKLKKDYPELTWDLDNWCLMCPDGNSLKGTRDDYTPEVFDEITRSMQHLSV